MIILSEFIRKVFERRNIEPFNMNTIIEFRYGFIEDFDKTYLLNFITNAYQKEKHKRSTIELLTVQFLQYAFIFDTREDKLEFCRKFIKRIEIDKEGFFKDDPDFKDGLLIIFRGEWDSLRQAKNLEPKNTEFSNLILGLESKVDSLASLESEIQHLINYKKHHNRASFKEKKEINYAGLFINKDIGNELKNIFRKYGYLDNRNKWLGQTQAKNELAIAYYVLKEPMYNFRLIKPGNKKGQLLAFYKEFGLNVSENVDSKSYTSIRNLTTEPSRRDLHDQFIHLFNPLKKYSI